MSECIVCHKRAYSDYCVAHKPRKAIKVSAVPKQRKRLRTIGKVTKQWISVRNEWIAKNLPDSGVWECHYCATPLTKNKLTLDHIIPRSRRPDLRFEHSNLVPACWDCNNKKGSRVYGKD